MTHVAPGSVHRIAVCWARIADDDDDGPSVSLERLAPLTVVGDVRCACGLSGRIEHGTWVPVAEGENVG